jgi:hypothetical protein
VGHRAPHQDGRQLVLAFRKIVHVHCRPAGHFWGQCYDHYFSEFDQFSAKKLPRFLKHQCYAQIAGIKYQFKKKSKLPKVP